MAVNYGIGTAEERKRSLIDRRDAWPERGVCFVPKRCPRSEGSAPELWRLNYDDEAEAVPDYVMGTRHKRDGEFLRMDHDA